MNKSAKNKRKLTCEGEVCESPVKYPKSTKNNRKNREKTPIKQGIFEKEWESLEFPENPLKPAQKEPRLRG